MRCGLISPLEQRESLYRQAKYAAALGIVANLTLGFVKLVAGIVGGSFALIADAVNSLGDALTSTVVMIALVLAQRPADREHPYGHTRADGIAATNVAVLIIVSALWLAWEAIHRLGSVQATPPWWALGVAGGNVVIKEILYQYNARVGRSIGSASLLANAWDHRSDALCSAAVFLGLILVKLGGPSWHGADEAAALLVVILIIVNGVVLFRKAASELMDLQADEGFVGKIRREAESVPDVKCIETLWVRKSGLEYFVDIHIEVDRNLTVEEGHRIGHWVKDAILEQFSEVRDVLVHLEPFPHPPAPSSGD